MRPRKLSLKTGPEHRGKRLDQVLAEWLPQALGTPVSKAKARKLLVAGAVYLNGRRVRIASKELQLGAKVDAFVDLDRLMSDERAQDRPFEMLASHILYEDDALIAVNKPAGLPTQPTIDEARDNLFAAVKRFLKKRDGQAEPYVGLHHRLDRDTSGVILFTKDPAANAGVAELFSKHLAQKTYHALSVRPGGAKLPPAEWQVKNFLGRLPGTGKRAKYGAVHSGGDPALTDFRLLESFGNALWIEARPRTGRTHQIRVHLSEDGMPILADATYGGPREAAPRLMLHAVSLTFPHPLSKVEISVQSPLPEDFDSCLQRFRSKR